MATFITFFILYLTCLNSAHSSQDNDWDLLIFTQQWPITVCKEWEEKNSANTCFFPKDKDSWTIHGIWPTKLGTVGPGFCNRSWHFDLRQIEPFETKLIQLWPDVEAGHDIYSLWAHEWTKHGTCAAKLEALNSESKYFTKGIEWLNKYSMNNILDSNNIVPSNTKEYSVENIYDAIKNKLGVNPVIECRQKEGKNYLVELRICFQKNLELIDCDGVKNKNRTDSRNNVITNCDTSQGVIYMQSLANQRTSSKLYVQLYKFISWLQWFTL